MSDVSQPAGRGSSRRRGTLGAFGGVFTPSILTILGIILFLRCGWVVGNAGLKQALLIVALAHAVSVLTSVSLAAIATNIRVRGGGDYFLISRSLGLEYGGALGIVLFLAQSVSVAFYCFGFGEAVANLLQDLPYLSPRILATLGALLLFGIAYAGADLATRFQYGVMLAIAGALGSFFWGTARSWDPNRLAGNWQTPEEGLGFWVIFAVFFPAVTGFTQGVSMSGDLKRPSQALPRGTFSAVAVSIITYTAATLAFAAVEPLEALRGDYLAFKRISMFQALFDVGIIAATLSSALASFLGAPRILQAMAVDEVFPLIKPFAHGHGPTGNPRRGVLLTGSIALIILSLGDLNAVASIISMFFLISYGLLNYATYVAARGASPSFRPRFRFFHARASLTGGLLCLGAMLAISAASGAIALSVVAALYQYLKRKAVPARWADSRRAFEFRKLKDTISEIERIPETEWTWQPQVLAVTEVPNRRDLIVRFACWLSGTSGFTTAVGIIEAGPDEISTQLRRREAEEEMRRELKELELDAFPLVVAATEMKVAIDTLVQMWGIGPVRANTALIDWYTNREESDTADLAEYGRRLRTAVALGCNVAVLDVTGKEWRRVQATPSGQRRIDIWWWENASSRLSLLFAYLMTRGDEWEDAPVRILASCEKTQAAKVEQEITRMLEDARIDAQLETVCDASLAEIASLSEASAVVFLPLTPDGSGPIHSLDEQVVDILNKLPITCLVSAARDLRLTVGPEPKSAPPEAAVAPRTDPAEDDRPSTEVESET